MTSRGSTAEAARPARDGVLAIDKARGPTSHDVVARVRKLLQTRRVGHAGTLDPMATGVLVVLVGEATKLSPWLTAHGKQYRAKVALGTSTDTLDADGRVVREHPLPAEVLAELEGLRGDGGPVGEERLASAPRLAGALAAERNRTEQVPPAFSAIQIEGRRSHERARRGEAVELPPRPVAVRALRVLSVELGPAPSLEVELEVEKGYYVRSFARDLGERLGVAAHLASLRRLASGPFGLEEAAALDETTDDAALLSRLIPTVDAARRCMPECRLTEEGALRARRGQPLRAEDLTDAPPATGFAACVDAAGRLVAVGRAEAGGLAVERGINSFSERSGEK